MKRFKIHNNVNGADFEQIGEAFVMNPGYGKPDRWVPTSSLMPADVARVVDTRPAPSIDDKNATESLLPSEYVVTVEDITQEIKDKKMAAIRAERNKRLTATDFTQLADAPLDAPQKQAMREYRQALRDLPETVTNPDVVVWPVKPEVQ